jgi:hypothetical protein
VPARLALVSSGELAEMTALKGPVDRHRVVLGHVQRDGFVRRDQDEFLVFVTVDGYDGTVIRGKERQDEDVAVRQLMAALTETGSWYSKQPGLCSIR